jgi:peptide/nickel transport system ATP-binding protein
VTELRVRDLRVEFKTPTGLLRAVDGVDFAARAGETVGLIGESGSGKSSIARAVMGLVPSSGTIEIDGQPVTNTASLRRLRSKVQLVFQDPRASLNPRMTVGEAIAEASRIAGRSSAEAKAECRRLLETVHLASETGAGYPADLSGGQLQRVAIARAIARQARILILDEVTSALDASVQAATLNLLRELQQTEGLGYILIAHDLSVVGYMSDAVNVLYLGRMMEQGAAAAVLAHPRHPYTASLLHAVPKLQGGETGPLNVLPGEIPDPHHVPSGCPFHTRCPVGVRMQPERTACRDERPRLAALGGDDRAACHYPLPGPGDLPPGEGNAARRPAV